MSKIVFLILLMLASALAPAYAFERNRTASAPSGVVVVVNDNNFRQEVLNSRTLVLVIFWANWSGPSRRMMPILESIANDYEGRVKVAKLDVDDNSRTTQTYNVNGLPTLIVFKNGAAQKRIVGPTTKEQIRRTLEKYLRGNR